MVEQNRRATDDANVPVPDPTSLTTAALEREVKKLHDAFTSGLDNLDEKLQTAIENRITISNKDFDSMEERFNMVEAHRIEQKSDTKAAVDAALIAQKEAVKEQTIASEKSITKSETATAEAIRQISTTFAVAIESVTRAINDVKDRVIAIETRANGNAFREQIVGDEQRVIGARESKASFYATIAVAGTIVAIIIAVVSIFMRIT